MAEFGFFSFSESFKSGIDFNTPDESIGIVINLSVETNLTVNALIERLVSSSFTVESNSTATALRILHAQSSIIVDGATLTLGTKIKLASIALSIESNLVSNSIKIAKAVSSINVDSSASIIARRITLAEISVSGNVTAIASIIKTAKASSVITPISNATVSAAKIMNIASAISGNVNLTIVGKIVLTTIKIIINNFGNVNVKSIKFNAANVISATDLGVIRTFLLIDDKPITNHNRKFDVTVDPIFVENINWNSRKSRYYKSSARPARRTFSVSWSYVPNSQSHTVDGLRGRDYFREVAGKPQHHVLKVVNMDENGTTPPSETSYNVLVKDYSETLIRRDLSEDVYFWDCSMSLEEV